MQPRLLQSDLVFDDNPPIAYWEKSNKSHSQLSHIIIFSLERTLFSQIYYLSDTIDKTSIHIYENVSSMSSSTNKDLVKSHVEEDFNNHDI